MMSLSLSIAPPGAALRGAVGRRAECELGPRMSNRNEVQGCLTSIEAEELGNAPIVKCADRHRTEVERNRLEEQVLCSVARFESRITTGPIVAVLPSRALIDRRDD